MLLPFQIRRRSSDATRVPHRPSATRPDRSSPYPLCLLSGVLFGLSWPSYPYVRLELLAWFWMVPLLLVLKHTRGLGPLSRQILLSSLVASAMSMSWLLVATVPGTLALFVVGALVFAAPFGVFYLIRHSLSWSAALWTAPVVWTAWEWLYHRTEGSFGFLTMAYTQANLYWLVQYVDVTGMWGITFWLVLFNVLVVRAIEDRGSTRALVHRLALVTAGTLAVPLAYSTYTFLRPDQAAGNPVSVLLVQPNVNPWRSNPDLTLAKTAALTDAAVTTQEPDLIVWPEGGVPHFLFEDQEARRFIDSAVRQWRRPLVTGTLDRANGVPGATPAVAVRPTPPGVIFNSAVLLEPKDRAAGGQSAVAYSDVYHKRRPMPFVERVPYAEMLPWLRRLTVDFGGSNNQGKGERATTFSFRDRQGRVVKLAAAICYDQLYPAETAESVLQGAELLVILSNDAWFSKTHGPDQLAAWARLRAIESRRSIARATNTGVTCIIDAMGRITSRAPWWSEQTLAGRVRPSQQQSLYARYPDILPQACTWLALGLLLASTFRSASPGLSSRVFEKWPGRMIHSRKILDGRTPRTQIDRKENGP